MGWCVSVYLPAAADSAEVMVIHDDDSSGSSDSDGSMVSIDSSLSYSSLSSVVSVDTDSSIHLDSSSSYSGYGYSDESVDESED